MPDEKQVRNPKKPVEPGKTPGKAEGGRDAVKKPFLEPGRTPGKAEPEDTEPGTRH